MLCDSMSNSFHSFQKEEDVEGSLWWKIIWYIYSAITKGDGVFVRVISQKIALMQRLVLPLLMLKGELDLNFVDTHKSWVP